MIRKIRLQEVVENLEKTNDVDFQLWCEECTDPLDEL